MACTEAEDPEREGPPNTARGGAIGGFGGAPEVGKGGLTGGGRSGNPGSGGMGGKAIAGGAFGLGGGAGRGGNTTGTPTEGGQAGATDGGATTCRFLADGGAGGDSGWDHSGGVGAFAGAGGVESRSGAGGTELGGAGDRATDLSSSGAAGTVGIADGAAGASSDSNPFAFCDDFDDGDAGGWEADSCSWSVVNDDESPVYESGGGTCMASSGSNVWTDQVLKARVKVVRFGGSSDAYRAGLVARYGGASNYYTLALAGNGSLRLLRGTSALIGSGQCDDVNVNVTLGTWYGLRLEVSGPMDAVRVRGYLDEALSHDCLLANDTAVSGSAGIITTGASTVARFDDFRVYTR